MHKSETCCAAYRTEPITRSLFQHMLIDHIPELPRVTLHGKSYCAILRVADRLSRASWLIAVGSKRPEEAFDALEMQVFGHTGWPARVTADGAFDCLRDKFRSRGTYLVVNRPDDARGRNAVEKPNQEGNEHLLKVCRNRPQDWPRVLPTLQMLERNTPRAALGGVSPAEVIAGQKLVPPKGQALDIALKTDDSDANFQAVVNKVKALREAIPDLAAAKARKAAETAVARRGARSEIDIEEGDYVVKRNDHKAKSALTYGPADDAKVFLVIGKPDCSTIDVVPAWECELCEETGLRMPADENKIGLRKSARFFIKIWCSDWIHELPEPRKKLKDGELWGRDRRRAEQGSAEAVMADAGLRLAASRPQRYRKGPLDLHNKSSSGGVSPAEGDEQSKNSVEKAAEEEFDSDGNLGFL
eukprot:g14542.t1